MDDDLEGDEEHNGEEVGDCQVGQEEAGDVVESTALDDGEDNEEIACHADQEGDSVDDEDGHVGQEIERVVVVIR